MEQKKRDKILKFGRNIGIGGCATSFVGMTVITPISVENSAYTMLAGAGVAMVGASIMVLSMCDDRNPLVRFLDNAGDFAKKVFGFADQSNQPPQPQ